MLALGTLLEEFEVVGWGRPDRGRAARQGEAVGGRSRVSEDRLVRTGLVGRHDAVALVLVDGTVDHSECDAAFVGFGSQSIALVLPVEEHETVLALFDQVQDHLVAAVIHQHRVVNDAVHSARGNLQQLVGHHGRVDGDDRRLLAFEPQHLRGLHLLVSLALLGRELVLQRVAVVGRNVDAVLELVADHDVAEQAKHCFFSAVLVIPTDGFVAAAHLGGCAHAVAEGKE